MKFEKNYKDGNKEIYGKHWKTFFAVLTRTEKADKIDWEDAYTKTYTYKNYKLKLTKSETLNNNPYVDFHVLGNHSDETAEKVKRIVKEEIMKIVIDLKDE